MPHTVAQHLAQKAAAYAVPAHLLHEYVPISGRREQFTPEEQTQIDQGSSRWLPDLMDTDATPVPEMMASPAKQGLLAGLLGAAAGGAGGYFAGKPLGHAGGGAAIGAAGLGAAAGLARAVQQWKHNQNLQEAMRRLPPGATRRDYQTEQLLANAVFGRYKNATYPGCSGMKHVSVKNHRRRYPSRTKKAFYDRLGRSEAEVIKAESCPHCGARQERGDDGNCNRCGKAWPMKKEAAVPWGSFLRPFMRAGMSAVEHEAPAAARAAVSGAERMAPTAESLLGNAARGYAAPSAATAEHIAQQAAGHAPNPFAPGQPAVNAAAQGFGRPTAPLQVAPRWSPGARVGQAMGTGIATYMDPDLQNQSQATRLGTAAAAGLAGGFGPRMFNRAAVGYDVGSLADMFSGGRTRFRDAGALGGAVLGHSGVQARLGELAAQPGMEGRVANALRGTGQVLGNQAGVWRGNPALGGIPGQINSGVAKLQGGLLGLGTMAGVGAGGMALAQHGPQWVGNQVNKMVDKYIAPRLQQQMQAQFDPSKTPQMQVFNNAQQAIQNKDGATIQKFMGQATPIDPNTGQVDFAKAQQMITDQQQKYTLDFYDKASGGAITKLTPIISSQVGNQMAQQMGFNGGMDEMKGWVSKAKNMLSQGGDMAAQAGHWLSTMADKLLGLVGMNTSTMSGVQKAMILLGALGVIGGGLMGSGMTAGLGAGAMAAGLAPTVMQHMGWGGQQMPPSAAGQGVSAIMGGAGGAMPPQPSQPASPPPVSMSNPLPEGLG